MTEQGRTDEGAERARWFAVIFPPFPTREEREYPSRVELILHQSLWAGIYALAIALIAGALVTICLYAAAAYEVRSDAGQFLRSLLTGAVGAISLLLYAFILRDFWECIRQRTAQNQDWVDVALRAFVLGFVALLPAIEGHAEPAYDWRLPVLGIGGVVLFLSLLRYFLIPARE